MRCVRPLYCTKSKASLQTTAAFMEMFNKVLHDFDAYSRHLSKIHMIGDVVVLALDDKVTSIIIGVRDRLKILSYSR